MTLVVSANDWIKNHHIPAQVKLNTSQTLDWVTQQLSES